MIGSVLWFLGNFIQENLWMGISLAGGYLGAMCLQAHEKRLELQKAGEVQLGENEYKCVYNGMIAAGVLMFVGFAMFILKVVLGY